MTDTNTSQDSSNSNSNNTVVPVPNHTEGSSTQQQSSNESTTQSNNIDTITNNDDSNAETMNKMHISNNNDNITTSQTHQDTTTSNNTNINNIAEDKQQSHEQPQDTTIKTDSHNNDNTSNENNTNNEIPDQPLYNVPPNEALARLLSNSVVEVMEALETLLIYTKNLLLYPDEKKYRKIKMTNIHYQERLGHLSGAIEAMNAIGYIPIGEYLRLDENRISSQYRDTNANRLKELENYMIDKLNTYRAEWGTLPNRLHSNHIYSAVSAASCYSAIGKRHNMEDDEIIIDSFAGDINQGYFGLYDGHGGRATVDFVVKALHMNLEQYLKRKPNETNLNEAFKQSYLATDGQLRRQNILRSGTTSVTCVVRKNPDTGKKMLFTANVGDSRAILVRDSQAVRLTVDHKASLPEEAKRITDAGGFIGRNKRVNGVLAISRALGDHMLKENTAVVSAEPYCCDTELTDKDSYVILACDGVWDVMSDQYAVDFVLQKLSELEPKLHESAQNHDTTSSDDNPQQTNTADNTAATTQPLHNNNDADNTTMTDSEISADNNTTPSTTNSTTDNSTVTIKNELAGSTEVNKQIENDVVMSYADYETAHNTSISSGNNVSTPNDENITTPRNWNELLYLVCKALVQEALDKRSLDNVTVMIVKL